MEREEFIEDYDYSVAKAVEYYNKTWPSLTNYTGSVVITSTPSGKNEWYNEWMKSSNNKLN